MDRNSRIYVAGHTGLIGSALLRRLRAERYNNLVTRTRAEVDLTDPRAVDDFFARERPEYVLLAAGKVGGIEANRTAPADFAHANLAMQTAVLAAAHRHHVRRLIFFGSGCMYPRECAQPMAEDQLMSGPLEPTSQAYAMAKLAGLAMCEAYNAQHATQFLTVIPASVYGPSDHFNLASAHVLGALVSKFHTARYRGGVVDIWGTGTPRREFIHADDVAEACHLLMSVDKTATVFNVGSGDDVSIAELAARVKTVVGVDVKFRFDATKPDGAPRKLLDSSRLRALGWVPKVSLEAGLAETYAWYRAAAQSVETR
jgi:GDP-L-fucose synthase